MKKFKLILSLFLAFILIFSCSKEQNKENINQNKPKKIAMIYSTGGKGDKSFNDSAYKGLMKAVEDFGIEISEYEPKDTYAEAKNQMVEFAQTGEYDLIIGIGYTMVESMEAAAKDFPEQKFVMIDDVIEGKDNVLSLSFLEQEGTFLTGALASMMSKTNKIAFLGGENHPVILRFAAGYNQGAKYINPNIEIVNTFINGSDAYNDPVAAKTLTSALIAKNIDVIMHAAGASGIGMFKAISEVDNVYGIGVDSDQDDEVKGKVLTSMIKKIDVAVYNVISDVVNDNFKSGIKYLGLKEDALGITDLRNTKELIGKENIEKLQKLIEDIKNGKIDIKDTI